jgi:hypothetical protein
MEKHVLTSFGRNYFVKILSIIFAGLAIWWVSMYARGLTEGQENNAFTLIYPFLSLFGGVIGLYVAEKWGGMRSALGKAISMFAFGLLFQFLGQAIYAYYIYIENIAVPYPSWGDFGYFGSVIFYILGSIYLIKVTGFKFSVKSVKGKLLSFLIPALLLCISYMFFLNGYEYDWSNKLLTFLDFGYPMGQAIYFYISVLAYVMSRNFLGGLLRRPLMFLIAALVFQYLCDFTFLYQVSRETWYVGGINDFMYCVSYFVMTLSLMYIGNVFMKIKES